MVQYMANFLKEKNQEILEGDINQHSDRCKYIQVSPKANIML